MGQGDSSKELLLKTNDIYTDSCTFVASFENASVLFECSISRSVRESKYEFAYTYSSFLKH